MGALLYLSSIFFHVRRRLRWKERTSAMFVKSVINASQIEPSSRITNAVEPLLLPEERILCSERRAFSYPIALGSTIGAITSWDLPWEKHFSPLFFFIFRIDMSVFLASIIGSIAVILSLWWDHLLSNHLSGLNGIQTPCCYSAILRPCNYGISLLVD